MYRSFGLALSTAVLLLAVPGAHAQERMPSTRPAPAAADIPARLVAAHEDLKLSADQVRALQALATAFRREDALHRVSSKPWITAQRLTQASDAEARALALLDPAQRIRGEALLRNTGAGAL